MLCAMMIGLEVWKFESLHMVCDDDKFGSLEVYMLCMMVTSLEVGKLGSLHTVCDDDNFGSLDVYEFTQGVR